MKTSRFEVDVNRPIEKSVYLDPEDAWGLNLWNEDLPKEIVDRSLQVYEKFYSKIEEYFNNLLKEHPWLIVYDIHSYNYRREGVDKYGIPEENPEVNIGTTNLNRDLWHPVIKKLINTLKEYNYEGRHLDVRENIKFKGGQFTKWLGKKYGDRICPIAIEIKKIFMDEWTGEPDHNQISHLRELLIASIKPVICEASKIEFVNEKSGNRKVAY